MVVTLQTFNKVKQIYLGQIRQKFPEVNSSWVSFYLGVKKFWEGRTTEIDSQGFHAHLNFWCVNSRRQDSSGSSRSKMHLSFYLTVISYANSEIKGKMQMTHAPPPPNSFTMWGMFSSVIKTFAAECLLVSNLSTLFFPSYPLGVAVKGNSIVLETHPSTRR